MLRSSRNNADDITPVFSPQILRKKNATSVLLTLLYYRKKSIASICSKLRTTKSFS